MFIVYVDNAGTAYGRAHEDQTMREIITQVFNQYCNLY